MTSYYVSMSTKHLKLLELFSTSSCVNLVTIALRVFKLHGGGSPSRSEKVKKKPVWIRLSDSCGCGSTWRSWWARTHGYTEWVWVSVFDSAARGAAEQHEPIGTLSEPWVAVLDVAALWAADIHVPMVMEVKLRFLLWKEHLTSVLAAVLLQQGFASGSFFFAGKCSNKTLSVFWTLVLNPVSTFPLWHLLAQL